MGLYTYCVMNMFEKSSTQKKKNFKPENGWKIEWKKVFDYDAYCTFYDQMNRMKKKVTSYMYN